ncbi:MAG: hypothetical protein AB1791_22845, partial [Chloroflexota bacterium]
MKRERITWYLGRLRAMSGGEILYRLCQQLRIQQERLQYHTQSARSAKPDSFPLSLSDFRQGYTAPFYFSPLPNRPPATCHLPPATVTPLFGHP